MGGSKKWGPSVPEEKDSTLNAEQQNFKTLSLPTK